MLDTVHAFHLVSTKPGQAHTATVAGSVAKADDSTKFATCMVSPDGGQDVFYSTSLAVDSDLTITPTNANIYDKQVIVLTGGCSVATQIACADGSRLPLRLHKVPAGQVLIAVENTYRSYDFGNCPSSDDNFALRVDAVATPAPPANDACAGAAAVSLPTVGSAAATTGTTRGGTNDFATILCPGSSSTVTVEGNDVVYNVTLGVPGVLKVTAGSAPRDLQLYVVASCGDNAAWACGDASLSSWFALPAGTYSVIVDQKSSTYSTPVPGDFTLLFELRAP